MRIEPLAPPYSEEVLQTFSRLMPEGMEPLRLFRTVAKNPRVLRRMQRGGLLDPGSLSIRQREIAILRTCFLCGAEYEWGVHAAVFAASAELDAEQLTASATPGLAELWSTEEALIVRLCDALHDSGRIDDELYAALSRALSEPQIIELTMLVGLYHTVSFVVNVAEVELEGWAPRFPDG